MRKKLLTEEQAKVLEKIAHRSKMDDWFSVKENDKGEPWVYEKDINSLVDGLTEYDIETLSKGEYLRLMNLVNTCNKVEYPKEKTDGTSNNLDGKDVSANNHKEHLCGQINDILKILLPNIGDHMFIKDDHTLVTKPLPPIIGDDAEYNVELIYITHSKTNEDNNEYQFMCGTNRGGLYINEMNVEYLKHLNKMLDEKKYTLEQKNRIELRTDISPKDLHDARHAAMRAVHDRIITPSARFFTSDQVGILKHYRSMFSTDTDTKEVFACIHEYVCRQEDVACKPEKWVSDTLRELNDLAEGITREQSQGLRR